MPRWKAGVQTYSDIAKGGTKLMRAAGKLADKAVKLVRGSGTVYPVPNMKRVLEITSRTRGPSVYEIIPTSRSRRVRSGLLRGVAIDLENAGIKLKESAKREITKRIYRGK